MSTGCLKVFLIEDEAMIWMMVVDMLEELGHRVVAEAGNVELALKLAEDADFDLAVLDVNLKGRVISPVAELIRTRGLPVIFATGYGAAGVPEEFRDRPILQKPFELKLLLAAIEAVRPF